MYPSTHFITSLLLAAVLYPAYGFYSLIVLLGGFLIDVDHNLWYTYKFRDLNPWNAYRYHIMGRNKSEKYVLNIFHVIEFWIMMAALSFYSEIVFIITIGMALHICLDIYDMVKKGRHDARAISLIFQWKKIPW